MRAVRPNILTIRRENNCALLTLAGFEIEEVDEGTFALERARTDRFDLIVLDTMIPGLDGMTLCRALRSQGINAASAILMLSARDTEADKFVDIG